jgi:hypothetical protein
MSRDYRESGAVITPVGGDLLEAKSQATGQGDTHNQNGPIVNGAQSDIVLVAVIGFGVAAMLGLAFLSMRKG